MSRLLRSRTGRGRFDRSSQVGAYRFCGKVGAEPTFQPAHHRSDALRLDGNTSSTERDRDFEQDPIRKTFAEQPTNPPDQGSLCLEMRWFTLQR